MSLRCRLCTAKAKCVNSRAGAEGIVNRRYHCGNCGSKFTSVEVIVTFAGETVPMPTGSKRTSLEQLRKNVMRSELEKLK